MDFLVPLSFRILYASLCHVRHLFSFLAKRGVKDEICSFDARKITPEIRASVQELLDEKAASFNAKVNFYQYIHNDVHVIFNDLI